MKKWFYIIVYVSLVFLVVKLYRNGFIAIPEIQHYPLLFVSFALLFAGMIVSTLTWRYYLHAAGVKVDTKAGLISVGLSIFAKYIPGKIFVILGRSEYIAEGYNVPRSVCTTHSLLTQLISIWTGLGLGIIGLYGVIQLSNNYLLMGTIGWSILTLVIWSPWQVGFLEFLFRKIQKRQVDIQRISVKKLLSILPIFILNWGLWCAGFYFFCISLAHINLPISTGFIFALAATGGIIAIFAPGGLGVRESIITMALVQTGIPVEWATSISIGSRLWFLMGEVFIFFVALVLKIASKK